MTIKEKIPNFLTIIRIVLIPIIIYSFYAGSKITNIIVASLFLCASITDFFDGYLARALKAQSNFGKCLDPIADKLLVVTALTMLLFFSNQNIYMLIPSLIIIGREIMVSGLREFLATINVSVPVTNLAKWKTAIQMVAITMLLLAGNGSEYVYNEIMDIVEAEDFVRANMENVIQKIGEILLWISAGMTMMTGYIYFKTGFKNF